MKRNDETGQQAWTKTQVALAVGAGAAIPLIAIFVGWILSLSVADLLRIFGGP